MRGFGNFTTVIVVAVFIAQGTPAFADDAMPMSPAAQAGTMAHQHAGDAPTPSPAAQRSVPAGSVAAQTVVYGSIDGHDLQGYFTRPAGAGAASPHPGLIVFHEWWGLNDNIRSMADQLAAQGYDVLAADLYGGVSAQTPDAAQKLMQAALSDIPKMDRNIEAAYAFLQSPAAAGAESNTGRPRRIGTLGWCFGGSASFEAAQVLSGKVDATVIYYGFVNDKPEALAKLKAPVLGLFGGQDQGIPAATVAAFQKGLEAQGAHPLIHIYPDAGHAFANPSGRNYRAADAGDAWARTLDFLRKNLDSRSTP